MSFVRARASLDRTVPTGVDIASTHSAPQAQVSVCRGGQVSAGALVLPTGSITCLVSAEMGRVPLGGPLEQTGSFRAQQRFRPARDTQPGIDRFQSPMEMTLGVRLFLRELGHRPSTGERSKPADLFR